MFVRPRPGNLYRHPDTKQLVPQAGFEAHEHELDIVRGLQCGDLVLCDPTRAVGSGAKRRPARNEKSRPPAPAKTDAQNDA